MIYYARSIMIRKNGGWIERYFHEIAWIAFNKRRTRYEASAKFRSLIGFKIYSALALESGEERHERSRTGATQILNFSTGENIRNGFARACEPSQ